MAIRKNTALIAGASRGLGLAMARELLTRDWSVIATVRGSLSAGVQQLASEYPDRLIVEQLDITRKEQIEALRRKYAGDAIDLVIANAGMTNRPVDSFMSDISDEDYTALALTNVVGPIRLLEAFETVVPDRGVLAAMSSILGSSAKNAQGFWPAYASTKAALNMLLRDFQNRRGGERAVIAMAPGWVRTEMGGEAADLSIEESIPRVIDALTGAAGTPGLRYLNYDGTELPW